MARWRLNEPHYLLTKDPTKWEYHETDRTTGRQKRVQFTVPRYFHPEQPLDWNVTDGQSGYIAVSDGHNAHPGDYIFEGEPTPGMWCLDDEAREISSRYADKWVVPTGPLESGEMGWAMKLTDQFIAQSDKITGQLAEAAFKPVAGMEQFMATMAKFMEQQQEMVMALTAKHLGIEKVVDNLEPLSSSATDTRPRVTRRL